MRFLSHFCLLISLLFLGLLFYLVIHGFPAPDWMTEVISLKNTRKPFQLFLAFFLLSIVIHPYRETKVKRLSSFLSRPLAIGLLLGFYFLLFLWHEIAEYLAIQINFIPFGFYDYMLYYFFQGKINYTGFLHGFYHINNALYLLAPIWSLFKSPLVLLVAHPFLLVLAGAPLYGLGRHYFKQSAAPLLIVFVYLNFRYLQNILHMNFGVEDFYPLFFFSLICFAVKQRWFWYFLFLILSLSIKEDSFFYLSAFGFLLLWMKGKRLSGFVTIVASLFYFYWIQNYFVVWTGSDIFQAVSKNFSQYGSTPVEIIGYGLSHVTEIIKEFLGSKEALRTCVKSFGRLLFIPLFSPWLFGCLATLFPLFVRGGENFVDLRFQYSAPFIGILFPALIDGLRRLMNRVQSWGFSREHILSVILIVLLFINGGKFSLPSWNQEHLKTIRLAQSIPQGEVVVTHGHLLPYIGYREPNIYFQQALERPENPMHPTYETADYYFIATNVNPYPMNKDFVEEKLAELKQRPDLKLIHEDGVRWLFERRSPENK